MHEPLMHERDPHRSRRGSATAILLLALMVAAVAVLAGCGGGGSSSGGTSGGESESGSEEAHGATEKSAEMKKLGEESAETPAVALKPETVGIVSIIESVENVHRGTLGAEEAAKKLGWKVLPVCDAEGLPDKAVTCAQSLLEKGATVMLGNVIAPTLVKHQMEEAKEKGIPWINFLGFVEPSPLILAQVVENEKERSEAMSKFVLEQEPPVKTAAIDEYPPVAAVAERVNVFKEEMAKANVEIVSHYVSDESDLEKTASWAQGVLAKYPELGVFNSNNAAGSYIANVIAANPEYRGKKYPERPLVVTVDATLENMNQMRKGYLDAVTEIPDEAAGWMAVDVAARHLNRGFEPEPEPNPPGNYGYPVNFLGQFIVTPEELPENPKEYPTAPYDYRAFFEARWAKEFK